MRSTTAEELVLERASRDGVPCCEVCGGPLNGERSFGWSLHHRRYRDGRSDQDSAQNLLVVCGGSNVDRCHGRIHGSKAEAMMYGWAVTRHGRADPLTIPVLIDRESRWKYFTASGEYADDPPEPA